MIIQKGIYYDFMIVRYTMPQIVERITGKPEESTVLLPSLRRILSKRFPIKDSR